MKSLNIVGELKATYVHDKERNSLDEKVTEMNGGKRTRKNDEKEVNIQVSFIQTCVSSSRKTFSLQTFLLMSSILHKCVYELKARACVLSRGVF